MLCPELFLDGPFEGVKNRRILKAWGHTAHRGANIAVMPTDEDDQDDRFFFNHPKRVGYFAA